MKEGFLLACLLAFAAPVAAQVHITSPTDGTTHSLNTTIQVGATCRDPSQVQKVDLYVDGVLHGTNTSEPYRWTLNTGNLPQWRTLRVVAEYRNAGNAEDLAQIYVDGLAPPLPPASVTYVGVDQDVTNFEHGVPYGNEGFWFPMFDASSPRSGRPTDDEERNGLPAWAGPMTHMEIWELWKFPDRTFSQDGPCKSKGGNPAWNTFTLPNGEIGLSGVILDPHGADNSSQSVNRITLGPGTPPSFYVRIVVDNTDQAHNSINRIRARGELQNGASIDPPTYPRPGASAFNGVADVYTFRYDGFAEGDFIKIQFNGMPGGTNNGGTGGSSFAGLLFDLVQVPQTPPQPQTSPQPQPSSQPTGTTAPGATASPVAPQRGSSGGSCTLSAQPTTTAESLGLLLLLAGLVLRRRQLTPGESA